MLDQPTQDEQRNVVIALILSGVVFLVWPLFFPAPPLDNSVIEESASAAVKPAEAPASATKAGPDGKNPTPTSTQEGVEKKAPVIVKDIAPRSDTMQADGVRLVFSNQGARLVQVNVETPQQYSNAGDLLATHPETGPFPLSLSFQQGDPIWVPADAMYEVIEKESKRNADGDFLLLTYQYQDPQGRFALTRQYEVDSSRPYGLRMTTRIVNRDQTVLTGRPALDLYLVQGDDGDAPSFLMQRSFTDVEAICRQSEDIERDELIALDEPKVFRGSPNWVGVNTRVFLFAAIFEGEGQSCRYNPLLVEESSVTDNLHELQDGPSPNAVHAQVEFKPIQLEPATTYTSTIGLYIGVKEIESLDTAGHQLSEAVDYGALTFLCSPLRWLLKQLYDLLGNWGFAIILLTFFLRLFIYPLNHKMYANMEKMKVLQPELEKIREKHKDDQQRVAEDTMKLFREHNTTPFSGCLPMLIQMPIFFALYYMILNSVELYQAPFMLWYVDLSAPDPYYVLPILMGAVMILQHSFMSVETPNPQMKMMMKVMPVMFTAFMLFLPAGLNLYYFFNTLLAVIQQWVIRRQFANKTAEAAT